MALIITIRLICEATMFVHGREHAGSRYQVQTTLNESHSFLDSADRVSRFVVDAIEPYTDPGNASDRPGTS